MGRGLRQEVMAFGRWNFIGFFVGATTLFLFVHMIGVYKAPITGVFGEHWIWLFGIGMFGALLLPMFVVQAIALRNCQPNCPACGNVLVGLRDLWKLNRDSECRHCHKRVKFEKPTRAQTTFQVTVMIGGLLLLNVIGWLVLQLTP